MAEETRDRANWTIRSMPVRLSKAAAEAAARADRTVAEWVGEAVEARLASEREPFLGEIVAPGSNGGGDLVPSVGGVTLSPEQIVAYLEAYKRVMEMRGQELKPNSRVLLGAQRMLSAPFDLTRPSRPQSPR
jgi:hypothetical protein